MCHHRFTDSCVNFEAHAPSFAVSCQRSQVEPVAEHGEIPAERDDISTLKDDVEMSKAIDGDF